MYSKNPNLRLVRTHSIALQLGNRSSTLGLKNPDFALVLTACVSFNNQRLHSTQNIKGYGTTKTFVLQTLMPGLNFTTTCKSFFDFNGTNHKKNASKCLQDQGSAGHELYFRNIYNELLVDDLQRKRLYQKTFLDSKQIQELHKCKGKNLWLICLPKLFMDFCHMLTSGIYEQQHSC